MAASGAWNAFGCGTHPCGVCTHSLGSKTSTPSSSPSPEENQGRASQTRTPERRTCRHANGSDGSAVASQRSSGTASSTAGAAGRADDGMSSTTGSPDGGSAGTWSAGKYSAYRVVPLGT